MTRSNQVPKFRQLSNEEMHVIENQIKRLEDLNRKGETKIENIDFFVSRFLPMEYQEKVEKYTESKRALVEDILQNTNNIIQMKTQLAKGVEIKDGK